MADHHDDDNMTGVTGGSDSPGGEDGDPTNILDVSIESSASKRKWTEDPTDVKNDGEAIDMDLTLTGSEAGDHKAAALKQARLDAPDGEAKKEEKKAPQASAQSPGAASIEAQKAAAAHAGLAATGTTAATDPKLKSSEKLPAKNSAPKSSSNSAVKPSPTPGQPRTKKAGDATTTAETPAAAASKRTAAEVVKKGLKERISADERKYALHVYKTKKEKVRITKEEWDKLAAWLFAQFFQAKKAGELEMKLVDCQFSGYSPNGYGIINCRTNEAKSFVKGWLMRAVIDGEEFRGWEQGEKDGQLYEVKLPPFAAAGSAGEIIEMALAEQNLPLDFEYVEAFEWEDTGSRLGIIWVKPNLDELLRARGGRVPFIMTQLEFERTTASAVERMVARVERPDESVVDPKVNEGKVDPPGEPDPTKTDGAHKAEAGSSGGGLKKRTASSPKPGSSRSFGRWGLSPIREEPDASLPASTQARNPLILKKTVGTPPPGAGDGSAGKKKRRRKRKNKGKEEEK